MEIGHMVFIAIFAAIATVDVYFDTMYRGIGAWLLARRLVALSPDSSASRLAAPFVGFMVIAASALPVLVILYAFC